MVSRATIPSTMSSTYLMRKTMTILMVNTMKTMIMMLMAEPLRISQPEARKVTGYSRQEAKAEFFVLVVKHFHAFIVAPSKHDCNILPTIDSTNMAAGGTICWIPPSKWIRSNMVGFQLQMTKK